MLALRPAAHLFFGFCAFIDTRCQRCLGFVAEDNDAGCQRVLGASCAAHEDTHVGRDVLEHFGLSLSYISTWTVWQKVVHIFSLYPRSFMYCTVHQHWCNFGACDLDVSGFPCTDFSPAGLREGIHGKTFTVLLCLLAWHRCCRTRIICLENVVQFPSQVLEALVKDMYQVHIFEMDPSASGCEHVSRRRVFFLLLLKGRDSSLAVTFSRRLCPHFEYRQAAPALSQMFVRF